MMQRYSQSLIVLVLLGLLVLPACTKIKRAAATSGAAVQHETAKVEHGAEKVGDKIGNGMERTADKIERAAHKVDQAAKRAGEKLPQ